MDGGLLGQDEAVEAGDGDAAGFEGADHVAGEVAAAADEDEEIAGGDGAILAEEAVASLDRGGDPDRDGVGQALRGGGEAEIGGRDGPGGDLAKLLDRRKRPKLDPARVADTVRVVFEDVIHDTVRGDPVGEDRVDQGQDGGGGAEGDVERDALPALAGAADPFGELDAGAGELVAIGTLERVDALFGVTDGEEGAIRGRLVRAGAEAGEELVGEAVGDMPLLGGGVLDLVEQEMVDAAVEFVEDPGGAGLLEEGLGAGDEVAVVELIELALAGVVGAQDRAGEAEQAVVASAQRAAARAGSMARMRACSAASVS